MSVQWLYVDIFETKIYGQCFHDLNNSMMIQKHLISNMRHCKERQQKSEENFICASGCETGDMGMVIHQ